MEQSVDAAAPLLAEVTRWGDTYAPVVGLVLAVVIAVALILVLIELRGIRGAMATYDVSVNDRLRALQHALERQGPARYAIAAYIAANYDRDRAIEEIRGELEAILGEWDRIEAVVDDVLTALDDAERRLGRQDGS